MSYQQNEVDIDFGVVNKDEVVAPAKSSSWGRTLGFAMVAVVATVGVFLYSSNSPVSIASKTSNLASSGELNGVWTVYKLTTANAVGTYSEIESFAGKYLCEPEYTNLGCNLTNKVACNLAGSFGIHWVDSSIFNDLSAPQRSVSDWANYVDSLGTETFNPFMHNKVQLFVTNLTNHYIKFTTDEVPFFKRLSMSAGSSTNDIAHLSVPMNHTATVYEIIGPASSLSDDIINTFSEWEDISCPTSHAVPYSLTDLIDSFEAMASAEPTGWEMMTGLQNPMGVQIQIPMSSLSSDRLQETVDLVASMSSKTFTVSTVTSGSDSCTVAAADINGISIRYVENDGDFTNVPNYEWTVADWEADILTAADQFVDSDSTIYSWNRYLDNHIGIYIPDATSNCEGYYDYIESTLDANSGDFQYGLRVATKFGVGTHYYTATAGIRSWEFNADLCARSNETDICGCLADNSLVNFEELYDSEKCGQYQ